MNSWYWTNKFTTRWVKIAWEVLQYFVIFWKKGKAEFITEECESHIWTLPGLSDCFVLLFQSVCNNHYQFTKSRCGNLFQDEIPRECVALRKWLASTKSETSVWLMLDCSKLFVTVIAMVIKKWVPSNLNCKINLEIERRYHQLLLKKRHSWPFLSNAFKKWLEEVGVCFRNGTEGSQRPTINVEIGNPRNPPTFPHPSNVDVG